MIAGAYYRTNYDRRIHPVGYDVLVWYPLRSPSILRALIPVMVAVI
jgi:hypothetical protein